MESINSDKYLQERRAFLGLLVTNFLFYLVFLIWFPVESKYNYPIYSVPIIAAYYIAEGCAFFGCQAYSWAASLTFRILFLLHDFSYFVTYAVMSSKTGDQNYPSYDWYWECNLPEFSDQYDDDYCRRNPQSSRYCLCYSKPYLIASCVFFFFVLAIGIVIICVLAKFPQDCCGPSPQPAVMMQPVRPVHIVNGQPLQVQPNYVVQQTVPMTTVVAQPAYITPQTTQVVQQNQVAVMPAPYQTLQYWNSCCNKSHVERLTAKFRPDFWPCT